MLALRLVWGRVYLFEEALEEVCVENFAPKPTPQKKQQTFSDTATTTTTSVGRGKNREHDIYFRQVCCMQLNEDICVLQQ